MNNAGARRPEPFFLLSAALIASYAVISIRLGALTDPEFLFGVILLWPITLPGFLAIVATSGTAVARAFRSSESDRVFVVWSWITIAYFVFLVQGTLAWGVSGFALVTVSFLYSALTFLNAVLSYSVTTQRIRMVAMFASLAACSGGFLLWDQQQGRFRFDVYTSAKSHALLLAAHKGNTEEVKRLLDEGANIAAKDDAGWDALYEGVRQRHLDTARLLLERGADPNTRENKSGQVCVDWSCNTEIYLSGAPVIVTAYNMGQDKVVELLLEHGADASATDKFCDSVISLAASGGDLDVIRILLRAGVDPNAEGKSCTRLPLVAAAAQRHADVVQALLQGGADPNKTTKASGGVSALHAAAMAKDAGLVVELLQSGSDPNARDSSGDTPLISACESRGHSMPAERIIAINQIVDALLKAGADVNAANGPNSIPWGETALMKAASAGLTQTVVALLKAGAHVNLQNSSGQTALMFAAMLGDGQMVQLLLQAGADKTLHDSMHRTARDWGIANGHEELAPVLE
jgi:ankyrin repeat protein